MPPSAPAADAQTARARTAALGGGRFDERFLRKLESLVMTIRRSARMSAGLLRANRASKRVGAGLEFADHRDYAAGDDLRYLDWNLYGRLGRLALRLFQEEEDLLVEVLVDASASMSVGSPPKLDLALQIGAALAYIGLANLDRVGAHRRSATTRRRSCRRRAGKGRSCRSCAFSAACARAGASALAAAVRAFLSRRRRRRRGLAIVISDFYDPAGHRAALDLLRHHRLEVIAIQVSAPQELAPDAARRRRAARRRDRRDARADGLAVRAGRLPPAPPDAAARVSRATAASAPSPASRSSPIRRSTRSCCACSARAACCASRDEPRVAAVRSVAGARRGRSRARSAPSPSRSSTSCGCGAGAWWCRSRRCGWTPPARAGRPAGRAACATCCR